MTESQDNYTNIITSNNICMFLYFSDGGGRCDVASCVFYLILLSVFDIYLCKLSITKGTLHYIFIHITIRRKKALHCAHTHWGMSQHFSGVLGSLACGCLAPTWSYSEAPGYRGQPRNSSAITQPRDHMSMASQKGRPRMISGALGEPTGGLCEIHHAKTRAITSLLVQSMRDILCASNPCEGYNVLGCDSCECQCSYVTRTHRPTPRGQPPPSNAYPHI